MSYETILRRFRVLARLEKRARWRGEHEKATDFHTRKEAVAKWFGVSVG